MTENQQSAAIELAWAMLVSQYTVSPDVTFGVTLTGRQEHFPGIKDMSGPTIATIPFRVGLSPDTPVRVAMQSLQSTAEDMVPHEQRGLYHIGRLGTEFANGCKFQTLVVIQSPPQYQYTYLSETTQDHDLLNHATFGTYPVTLVCDLRLGGVRVQAVYDNDVVPAAQMQRILNQFSTVLQQMTECADGGSLTLRDVETISGEDMQTLNRWNNPAPPKLDVCVHQLILEHCREQPNSFAVCAWDGSFTYREINDLSQRLAVRLTRSHGVRPETFVPLYFQKSRWTTIAILAVMRTGAAFVLLDPAAPLSRSRDICRRVNALCLLSATALSAAAKNLADNVIPVGPNASAFSIQDAQEDQGSGSDSAESPCPSPSNALYAVFTSGSTGTPKGVLIENVAFATSAKAYIDVCQIDKEARALQFASYAFDVSISDTLVTLAAGGCICVPSEEERKADISWVVTNYDVNWVDFTPSLLRHLSPDQMPSLQTIILGGEPMSQVEIDTWSPHVKLLNVYGPAECCVLSTVQANVTQATDPRDIGYATGCVCWVVDPEDVNRLMPIGTVGELVIEGAIVGRCYLNDEEGSAASFIPSPAWMKGFRSADSVSRFYRTGDLVQYTNQGSLRYVGRRDMQVKLRGQRVELEDVEYHTLSCYTDAKEVIADVLSLDGRSQLLVAFVAAKDKVVDGSSAGPLLPATSDFHRSASLANELLSQRVPTYMIPSVFFPVAHILRTMSDKTDRRRLRQAATALTRDQLESYFHSPSSTTKRPPLSEPTRKMQAIWAQVLQICPDRIGLDDGFFQLGGDSITAMKVAAMAKSQGLRLSIPDLFQRGSSLETIVEPEQKTENVAK